jgi:hypothetical protein
MNTLNSTHLHNEVGNGINNSSESIKSSFGFHNKLEVQAPILVKIIHDMGILSSSPT